MDRGDLNRDGPEVGSAEKDGSEADVQALNGHLELARCRRCGRHVKGKRTNGYCGDRCRLRDRREKVRNRRLELLDTISTAVEELRRELDDSRRERI